MLPNTYLFCTFLFISTTCTGSIIHYTFRNNYINTLIRTVMGFHIIFEITCVKDREKERDKCNYLRLIS